MTYAHDAPWSGGWPISVPPALADNGAVEATPVDDRADAPALCDTWMRIAAAEPAERFLDFAFSDARPAAGPCVLPSIGDLPFTRTFVGSVTRTAPSLRPEPAASAVHAVMKSRPAAYVRPASQLRFTLHAIDEVAARTPAAAQAPRPAGPWPGPAPVPVESMPAVLRFEAVAVPTTVELRIPSIRCIIAQVLPQARAVEAPSAIPVECLPSADRFRAKALAARPALRYPTLARFQPAADPSEPLAAPAPAPGPAAVESMPSVAFAAVALPVAPAIALRDDQPRLRVGFGYPAVPLPAPEGVAPRIPVAQPASLDPLSRIAAQPAGAQPERPKPAIPRPGLIPLEYYSHRIASLPVKPIEAVQPRIAILRQPWALSPALVRFEDLAAKKRVLPFEAIFGKKGDASKRARITLAGKIAATIMVGLALWTGSRVANLSQHTEALRAQVASSERTVTVAGARDPNGDFGKGPAGRLRRAIANRAATEITDNFHGGMAAWGAEPKNVAPGWKRNSAGYVSIGDMALFQPSLHYTDYRMEFYGQIEDKSMNWVVRAQDKKNYYAMKFKVIEPGLRPIIAMVHYGVVNGKMGHKVETPLNVMVHNNEPYHVAVDVRGNHFTASIEGETVESWTDETLPRGGVGFFADAGEKARLYWMRLSRNQDWLGRVCAYLSGDSQSPQQTAEFWGPEFPHERPEPARPRGAELARAAAALDDIYNPRRAKTPKQRRNEAWI